MSFKKLLVILITFSMLELSFTYNLSPKPNLILKRPNLMTFKNKTRSSYFGYTIILREKSIFISAPRDQSTIKSQAEINEPGAIYKCDLDIIKGTHTCKVLLIDNKGNIERNSFNSEIKDNQWLGASMVSGDKDANDAPFLVCAPRFDGGFDPDHNNDYLHGICYWTNNTTNTYDESKSTSSTTSFHQIKDLNAEGYYYNGYYYNYQLGQQGFSAHITKGKREFLMGAPGVLSWTGAVIIRKIGAKSSNVYRRSNTATYSYFGYAVASGYLESSQTKKTHYVATQLHSLRSLSGNFGGEVVIFDCKMNNEFIEEKWRHTGQQYGELFGTFLLVEDLNNDLLDEIIVAAPAYHIDDMDVGAVYVFVNDGNFNFREPQIIVSPFKTSARFGTTMSMLGDLNQDDYNDIAIAAPFYDDYGGGAVCIYLGSSDGLQMKPSQIIKMSTPIESLAIGGMFGLGLANGYDIDDNGFNDLAIGAPGLEMVYLYRAYPVVYVEAKIGTTKPRVHLNETFLEVEFCYKIATKAKKLKTIELNLHIKVDAALKRMLLDNGSNEFSFNINATAEENCQTFNTTLKIKTAHLFTPMIQELSFALVNDAKQYKGEVFCEKCAILDSTSRNPVSNSVTFIHGCKGKTCNVDLKLKALEMPLNFTLGSSNTLYVSYLLENHEEKAYDTKVEFSSPFLLAKIPPNCKTDHIDERKLICHIGGTQSFTGNSTLNLAFDVSGIQNVEQIIIMAKATSAGNELKPADNYLNSTIILQTNAALEVVGKPKEIFESIYKAKEPLDIVYKLEFQNNGPSALYNLSLILQVPVAKTSQNIYTDLKQSYVIPVRDDVELVPIYFKSHNEHLKMMELSNNSKITEIQRNESQLLPQNSTISLYCNTTTTTVNENCAHIKLPISTIKSAQKISFILHMTIMPGIVKNVLEKKYEYLQAFMDVSIDIGAQEHVFLNITKIISPQILVNIGPQKTPVWIIIAAAVGGLIFLVLLYLVLRKLGFFKRQTKEEMEELINEKLEKERMKAELEKSFCVTEDQQ